MSIFILAIYFLYFVIAFRIYDLPKRVGISFELLVGLFAFKILMGCLNLYFHNSEYLANDAHNYFLEANILINEFSNEPSFYLKDWLFNWGDIGNHLNFLDKGNAVFWSDIGRQLHLRFMILCNFLSFGHEYVNVIFYNVFFFIGGLALYKSFIFFKPNQKWVFIIIIFLIPSISFWCSGIHKDGFVLSLIGLVSWASIKLMNYRTITNGVKLVVLLILLLAIRYFYFLVFLPFYILFWLTSRLERPLVFYLSISILGGILFFSSANFSKVNLMSFVVNKQTEFMTAKGYSDMETPVLNNTAESFIENFPVAVSHVFLEPIPKMGQRLKYDVTAIDSLFILLLLSWAFYNIKRRNMNISFIYMMLFYSFSCLLFIGYTIPNLGALIRYESPFICLFLLGFFALGDFSVRKLTLK